MKPHIIKQNLLLIFSLLLLAGIAFCEIKSEAQRSPNGIPIDVIKIMNDRHDYRNLINNCLGRWPDPDRFDDFLKCLIDGLGSLKK